MTEDDFKSGINRLIATFGSKPYGPERVLLIWQEVKDIRNPYNWKRIVDELIGTCRFAPLLPDIRLKKAEFKERWLNKNQTASIIPHTPIKDDEAKLFLSWIMLRARNRMEDGDWAIALTTILEAYPAVSSCCNEGLVYTWPDGYLCVSKCPCPKGVARAESFPSVQENYSYQKP